MEKGINNCTMEKMEKSGVFLFKEIVVKMMFVERKFASRENDWILMNVDVIL